MSGLPREILKWMQSLDLSYSVKNVKRDFANGFLVAEILSRYYKGTDIISLHSYDNGLGLVKRVQNWALLEKVFKKLGFPIERTLIDQVIHCEKDAAIPLMEQLYTLLTHKTITSTRAVRDQDIVPPFARPTAAQLVRERMSQADMVQVHSMDAKVAPEKAAAVLAEHMHKLKMEKAEDPARFQTTAKTGSIAANSTGKMGARRAAPSGDTMGRSGAQHLPTSPAARKSFSDHAPSSPSPAATHAFSPAPVSPHSHAAAAAAAPPAGVPALQTLSGALLATLGYESAEAQQLLAACSPDEFGVAKEPITAFAEGQALDLQDGHCAFVIAQLSAQTSSALTHLSLHNPKDFWQTTGVLLGLLERLAPDSAAFASATTFMTQFGLGVVHRDPSASAALFTDFTLAKFVGLLRSQPRKIFSLARVAYAFVPETPEHHGKVIRGVQEALLGDAAAGNEAGWRIFYAIVAALAPFEGPLLEVNNFQLLNSYLKMVQQGLAPAHSPRVRATALSILAPLAANPAFDERIMRAILDIVRSQRSGSGARGLAQDEWLLDAEMMHVLSCALSQPWVLSNGELVAELHEEVEGLLRADGVPYPTLRAGLSHLTHVLGSQPALRRVWMNLLLKDDVLRSRVLSTQAGVDASASAGDDPSPDLADSFCPALRSVWHPLTVAQSLGDQVRVAGLDNLTLGHVELLDAATEDAFGPIGAAPESPAAAGMRPPFPDAEGGEWSGLFLSLRDHLVVELCEDKLSELVISVLRRFLLDPRTSAAAQTIFLPVPQPPADGGDAAAAAASGSQQGSAAPPLYCILRFMSQSAEDAQLSLAGFLEELAQYPALVGLVHRVLMVFADNEADKFAQSPLEPLLAKLDQQAAQAGVTPR